MDHAVNWKDLPFRFDSVQMFYDVLDVGYVIIEAVVSLRPLTLQDDLQQHLLQSGDGHGQRDLGALQSSSF